MNVDELANSKEFKKLMYNHYDRAYEDGFTDSCKILLREKIIDETKYKEMLALMEWGIKNSYNGR